ncbi:MAG: hypothetical protein JWO80_970 [Bryobacterales bacterium]|nr:hypothetical protein [Bryobacterales bacterium]
MLLGFVLLLVCHGVEGDAILGRDLAAADPQFSGVPRDARLGYAPMPGSRRTLSAAELKRLAAGFGVSGDFHDLCFEYPTRQLQSGEILEALRDGLKVDGADIQVTEFSLYAAPKGDIVFPLSGLSRPSPLRADEPVIWRGYVKYAGGRKFSIWAKVRLHVTEMRVVATEDLAAVANPVAASQLRVETVTGFPSLQPFASTVQQVAGHRLRRAVRQGAPVSIEAVEAAGGDGERAVNRGESVEVEVDAGPAHLKFEGRAESGGVLGEIVTIRNAKSGRTFAARVVGKGKVEVVTGATE